MNGKAAIVGIASYLPEILLDNERLGAENPDWDIDKIYGKTGVRARHLARDDQTALDLGLVASHRLFEKCNIDPSSVEFVIFCTQSPDYFLPTSACIIQNRLGLSKSCGALDINLGCSGFVYGLSLAKGLIETGSSRNVLLITAETYSKYIIPSDRSVRTVFGDGAAATFLSAKDSANEFVGPFIFGTDGSGKDHLIVRTGAHRNGLVNGSNQDSFKKHVPCCTPSLFMNGAEVFNFTVRTVPQMVNSLLIKAQLSKDQINYFIFHQASKIVLEHLRKKICIPNEKFHIDLEGCGNTVSSTIPIALETALDKGVIGSSDLVLIGGFGVGFSWAATILRV